GSLLGQLLPRLLGLRRRRERLIETLVRPERAFRAADRLYKGYASYDVRPLVGEGPWLRRRPKPGARDGRIQELARRARHARSEDDFSEVETEVAAAVGDVSRWIDVERATIALAKLLGAKHPNRAGQLFVDRFAYLDANELREYLKTDRGAKAAPKLLAAAREERELLDLASD